MMTFHRASVLLLFAAACDASDPPKAEPSPDAPAVAVAEDPPPPDPTPPTPSVPATEDLPKPLPADEVDPPAHAEPEPTPPADAEPPAPLPALPFGEWSPSTDDALLSEKMARRLRSSLRKQHGAPTQLAKTILMPRPDGGLSVVGLYEYSAFQACVTEKGGGPEARSACVDEAVDDHGNPMAARRKCTKQGVVRARFGAPPEKNPAYGGALAVEAARPLDVGCTLDDVRSFELRDVDGDQRVELALDLIGNTPDMTFREPTRFDVKTRFVAYYRDDLQPQFEEVLAEWGFEGMALAEMELSRIAMRDANGDGRQDIVRETVFVHPDMCGVDGDGWPKLEECMVEGDDGEDEMLPIQETVLLYDPEADAWDGPAPEDP